MVESKVDRMRRYAEKTPPASPQRTIDLEKDREKTWDDAYGLRRRNQTFVRKKTSYSEGKKS